MSKNTIGANVASELHARKKVLLSFVGNRDPYPDKKNEKGTPDVENPGSIISLCETVKPDILCLFPSCREKNPVKDNNTEWRAEDIKKIISESNLGIECLIYPLDVKDATDFEELSVEFSDKIDAMIKELESIQDCDFHLNCSSGTPQMSAIGYVFANSGRIPNVTRWQCKDPRFVDDASGELRIKPINTSFIEESVFLKRIEANAEVFDFNSLRNDCRRLSEVTSSIKIRETAQILGKAFDAFSLMDNLRYQDSYVIMRDLTSEMRKKQLQLNITELLERQKEMLKILQAGSVKESSENLTDIYFNMYRCYERGAYADVLSRFWRMGEGCVYFRLENVWNTDPRASSDMGFSKGRQALFNGFRDSKFKNLWGKTLNNGKKLGKLAEDLIKKRNHTIVAHGMKPVSDDNAEDCLLIAESMLKDLIPGTEKLMKDYPFQKEHFKELVRELML